MATRQKYSLSTITAEIVNAGWRYGTSYYLAEIDSDDQKSPPKRVGMIGVWLRFESFGGVMRTSEAAFEPPLAFDEHQEKLLKSLIGLTLQADQRMLADAERVLREL